MLQILFHRTAFHLRVRRQTGHNATKDDWLGYARERRWDFGDHNDEKSHELVECFGLCHEPSCQKCRPGCERCELSAHSCNTCFNCHTRRFTRAEK